MYVRAGVEEFLASQKFNAVSLSLYLSEVCSLKVVQHSHKIKLRSACGSTDLITVAVLSKQRETN